MCYYYGCYFVYIAPYALVLTILPNRFSYIFLDVRRRPSPPPRWPRSSSPRPPTSSRRRTSTRRRRGSASGCSTRTAAGPSRSSARGYRGPPAGGRTCSGGAIIFFLMKERMSFSHIVFCLFIRSPCQGNTVHFRAFVHKWEMQRNTFAAFRPLRGLDLVHVLMHLCDFRAPGWAMIVMHISPTLFFFKYV